MYISFVDGGECFLFSLTFIFIKEEELYEKNNNNDFNSFTFTNFSF